jgi:hypothetical protein
MSDFVNSGAENATADPATEVRSRILGETAKIAWTELQRFFAAGHAIAVVPELDLVEVAYQMSEDNDQLVGEWLAAGKVRAVSDAQAIEWLGANALMWTVVIKPWVLVQPIIRKQ